MSVEADTQTLWLVVTRKAGCKHAQQTTHCIASSKVVPHEDVLAELRVRAEEGLPLGGGHEAEEGELREEGGARLGGLGVPVALRWLRACGL